MTTEAPWLVPDWPAPARVRALSTTRQGGVSEAPYGLADGSPGGLNLGTHVGDDAAAVAANRARLAARLPAAPGWLEQVHGCAIATEDQFAADGVVPQADASIATTAGRVCAVMTADCLPVLLCDRAGTVVGAAHAGWRGLCGGVIEATLARMGKQVGEQAGTQAQWLAWLGPAIGPDAFEVGAEVRQAFLAQARPDETAQVDLAFRAGAGGKYFADIYALARIRLARAGCTAVYGGDACTVGDAQRFYSYRRDGVTGRMASLVWLAA
ncbi:peptidoglycan editing factor PgeF [Cupriavidus basilensis]|uniref:peptidoglycan editing factor PgeF n=1 Tax=Cupriavidus basilensis TaxID=68895 RepID=UPI00157BA9A0|nr:peptidoglycan editing factor PgeF [Cupriavidus basilensis]NUA27455.1 peptidoglycan editing factor PgeF [Cupriavidus basilensis]